jgi:hypothetical protein
MKPVHYIVTDGEYSDYHIKAAFSKREAAESYISIHGGYINEFPEGEVLNPDFYKYEVIEQEPLGYIIRQDVNVFECAAEKWAQCKAILGDKIYLYLGMDESSRET